MLPIFFLFLIVFPLSLLILRCATFFVAAGDVYWLNSLEGGHACLLVDSYDNLADGVALEEAFLLIEVGRTGEICEGTDQSARCFIPRIKVYSVGYGRMG